MVFNLLKQLKKKIRLKRKRLIFGSYVLLAAAAYLLVAYEFPKPAYREAGAPLGQAAAPEIDRVLKAQQEQTLRQIRSEGGQRLTYIQRSYVCGEEQQELGLKSAEEITALNGEHPDWILSLNSGGSVIFTQHIDDLSPKCKQSAYFGVDESGNLSLFDGLPANDKVIRTFFQLNIQYLESTLPKETVHQLHEGIRVSDVAEFNSVLSTFSDYAVQESEKAMSPNY
ncbi:BofC C-terminal domain-containing protein [Paenibacillus chitinolyticus]|uniref:BofC C-terminal domain-containing protein n=1 Tax=Paenibacillus TaxID=44249 RepID=UPI001C47E5D4|nr:BofC C-terminal domain-containing protein [Paenibacillus chitinolyticus]MBV6712405.1 BofC C-terminal domain-containing protein [Paenibacillus chitinolyticus]